MRDVSSLPIIPEGSEALAILESMVAATDSDRSGSLWSLEFAKGLCSNNLCGYEVNFHSNTTHEYIAVFPPLPGLPEYSNTKCTNMKWVLPSGEESWRTHVLDRLYSAATWNRDRGVRMEREDNMLHENKEYAEQYRKWKPTAPDGSTLSFLPELRIFTPAFPEDGVPIDTYYVDQAPQNSQFFDRFMMSTYTPSGIKDIDSWFSRQIQSIGHADPKSPVTSSGVTSQELREMLYANPHLHSVIKTNLLDNLSNYEKRVLESNVA